MSESLQFNSFKEFYPYYLSEHQNARCRVLHFIGSTLVLMTLVYAIATAQYSLLWLLPFMGYGFAWVGHFMFEKNKPATFKFPFYSLMGDWVMYKDMLVGKVSFTEDASTA